MEEEISLTVENNTKIRKQIISKETLSQEWGDVCRVEENSDSDGSEASEKNEKNSEARSKHTSPMTRRLSMRVPSIIFRPPEINELENAEFLEKLAKEIATFPNPPTSHLQIQIPTNNYYNTPTHHTPVHHTPHHHTPTHSNTQNHTPQQLFQQSPSIPSSSHLNSSSASAVATSVTMSNSNSSVNYMSSNSEVALQSFESPPEGSPTSNRKTTTRWAMVAKFARRLTSTDNQNNEASHKSKSKPRRTSKAIPNISEDQYV